MFSHFKGLGSNKDIKLRLSEGKVTRNILVNVDGITPGIEFGTELGSLDGSSDGSNDEKLEGLFIGGSLVSTFGKGLWSNKGIRLVLSDDRVLGNIPGNVYGITLGIDIETEMGSLDVSFDGSNDGNMDGIFIGDLLGYNDVKVLGFD